MSRYGAIQIAHSHEWSVQGEFTSTAYMRDGCMLPTRPHKVGQEEIGSWKEMKLGRIFREQDHLALGQKKPNIIRESMYVSHFGKQEDFTDKLSVVTDKFEDLDERLVFINDGAIWIANFIKNCYPNATDILDFYHASEYLHGFAKGVLSKQLPKNELEQRVGKIFLAFVMCFLFLFNYLMKSYSFL